VHLVGFIKNKQDFTISTNISDDPTAFVIRLLKNAEELHACEQPVPTYQPDYSITICTTVIMTNGINNINAVTVITVTLVAIVITVIVTTTTTTSTKITDTTTTATRMLIIGCSN